MSTFVFSSCSMFYKEKDGFQKGSTVISYESLNSTITSAIDSFELKNESINENILN